MVARIAAGRHYTIDKAPWYRAAGQNMVTSALVVTLGEDDSLRRAARTTLEGDSRLELGDAIDAHLPVVTTTDGLAAAEQLVEEIGRIPGVVGVHVVRVDFDPNSDVDAPIRFGRARSEDERGAA
ncbi:MAG TPA: hypothetical protein VJV78_33270 [Polyangiales bacterium]|nr:hypothetical protein [Polyangiales bacterium]